MLANIIFSELFMVVEGPGEEPRCYVITSGGGSAAEEVHTSFMLMPAASTSRFASRP